MAHPPHPTGRRQRRRIDGAVTADGGGVEGSDWYRAQTRLREHLGWVVSRGVILRDPETVEVAPRNTAAEMERKRAECFRSGVQLVWEIDPRARTARFGCGTSTRGKSCTASKAIPPR